MRVDVRPDPDGPGFLVITVDGQGRESTVGQADDLTAARNLAAKTYPDIEAGFTPRGVL